MSTPFPVPPSRSSLPGSLAPLCALIVLAAVTTAQGCQLPSTGDASPPNDTAVVTPTARSVAVPPNAALLSAPGPYLLHRIPSAPESADSAVVAETADTVDGQATDLAVRHADGALAATWRLPNGGRMRSVGSALSPDGRWLAYITGDEPDWHLTAPMTTPLTLHVLDLADGSEAFATRLLHNDIEHDLRRLAGDVAVQYFDGTPTPSAAATDPPGVPTPWQPGWAAEDVLCAFGSGLGVLAWSPASTHLAFVGALDGPSGDVYVADVAGWQVRRVSDEPTHAFRLAWSPDGQWILHEGAGWCSRAAGDVMAETSDVSSVDGSIQRHVWDGSGTGSWLVAWPDGWIGEHEAIIHQESNRSGCCAVVRLDVSTGISRTLATWAGEPFVINPPTRQIALSGNFAAAPSTESMTFGVYIVDADSGALEQLSDQACLVEAWGAPERPFVRLQGYGVEPCDAAAFGKGVADVAIGPFGRFPRTRVSMAGTWRVVVDERGWTLFDMDGRPSAAHAQDEIADITFRPDERGLFWGANDRLWYADVPDGEARAVGPLAEQALNPFDVAWLMVAME